MVKLTGPAPWAGALAVGLAMVAMHLTRSFHPPAGIDPLLVVVNDMSWGFLLVPRPRRRLSARGLRLRLAQPRTPTLGLIGSSRRAFVRKADVPAT